MPRSPRTGHRGDRREHPRQRGRERPRQLHSREAVLDAALRVLDTEGLDAVTMRRVAVELGTGPASLYAHVRDKDDLVDALLERVIGEFELGDPPDAARWQEQIKQFVRTSRAAFLRHNDIARASLGRIPTGANAMAVAEWLSAVLKSGGVPDQVAAWSLDILPLYFGAVAYEESLERLQLGDADATYRYYEGVHDSYRTLDPGTFPMLTALYPALVAGDGEQRFEFGLDMLVRGIASTVPAAQISPPARGDGADPA